MANKSIQLKDESDNLYPSIYRTYVNGTQSVPSSTDTTFSKTISLPAGTWMICAFVSWSTSSAVAYNVNVWFGGIRQRTVRGPMNNGGGTVNTVIFTTGSSGTLSVSVWQNSGSTSNATYWIDAIKLS